jgi:hypothetical protein
LAPMVQTARSKSGQNTSYSTATALLKALNEERLLRGLEALSLEQLGPKII